MNIRIMTIEDYEKVYTLWLSCEGMGLNNLDDSRDGIERFLNRNPETCFVAENDNRIVGVIIVGNDGRRGYIYHTAVNQNGSLRNVGVVKSICKQVQTAAYQGSNHGISATGGFISHGYSFSGTEYLLSIDLRMCPMQSI